MVQKELTFSRVTFRGEKKKKANFGLPPAEKEMKSNIKQEPIEKKDYILESEKEKPKSRSKKTTSAVS
jgi:hypothetical protein